MQQLDSRQLNPSYPMDAASGRVTPTEVGAGGWGDLSRGVVRLTASMYGQLLKDKLVRWCSDTVTSCGRKADHSLMRSRSKCSEQSDVVFVAIDNTNVLVVCRHTKQN